MITCQVGTVIIPQAPHEHYSKIFPITLTGFNKKPKIAVALKLFYFKNHPGPGVTVEAWVKSPTSAAIYAYSYDVDSYVEVTYVACGN